MATRKQPSFRSMELNPYREVLKHELEVDSIESMETLRHIFKAKHDVAWDYDFQPRTEPGKEWYNPKWFYTDTTTPKIWFADVEDFDLAVLLSEVLKTEDYLSDTVVDLLKASNELKVHRTF